MHFPAFLHLIRRILENGQLLKDKNALKLNKYKNSPLTISGNVHTSDIERTQPIGKQSVIAIKEEKEMQRTRVMHKFQEELYQRLEARFNEVPDQGAKNRNESRAFESRVQQNKTVGGGGLDSTRRHEVSDSSPSHVTENKENSLIVPILINTSGKAKFGKPMGLSSFSHNSNIRLPAVINKEQNFTKVKSRPNVKVGVRSRTGGESLTGEQRGGEIFSIESMESLLMGNMSSSWRPDDSTLTLFIHSAMTDTEVERTWLIERVYPALKDWARTHSMNLEVLDSQWGMRDAALDSASLRHITAASVIDDQSRKNIFVITMMAHKYGEPVLPLIISQEDFQAIREVFGRMSEASEPPDPQGNIPSPEEPGSRRPSMAKPPEDRVLRERRKSRYRKMSMDLNLQAIRLAAEPRARKESRVSIKGDLEKMEEEQDVKLEQQQEMISHLTSQGQVASKENFTSKDHLTSQDKVHATSQGRVTSRGPVTSSMSTSKTPSAGQEIVNPNVESLHLFTQWYRLDENSEPPVYRLQDISKHYPEIWSKVSSERQSTRSQWRMVARKLSSIIQDGAREAMLDPSSVHKLTTSAAELEFEDLFGRDSPSPGCLWLRREFIGSPSINLSDQMSRDYLDLLPLQQSIDQTAANRLSLFFRSRVEKQFPKEVQNHYSVEWTRGGIDPSSCRTHRLYIEQLCDDVTQAIIKHLSKELVKESEAKNDQLLQLASEVHQHVSAAHKYYHGYRGREQQLYDVMRYLEQTGGDEPRSPLLILGSGPGCGLSSFVAKCSQMISSKHSDAAVLIRFIDLTEHSTDVLHLLSDLCQQIQYCYSHNDQFPDLKTLTSNDQMNQFTTLLDKASSVKPLYIFIDSLHYLTDNYEAKLLNWLPRSLPPHVRIVVSTLEGDMTAKSLTKPLNDSAPENENQIQIVRLENLPARHWETVLNSMLNERKKKITNQQRLDLLKAIKQCTSAVYVSLLIKDFVHLTSYDEVNLSVLGDTVQSLASHRFSRAEKIHGEALVRRALGYIAAAGAEVRPPEGDAGSGGAVGKRSGGLKGGIQVLTEGSLGKVQAHGYRHGLTFNELEDLLSMDDAVIVEISDYCKLPLRRVPSMLLARLLYDLKHYLKISTCTNSSRHTWFNLLHSSQPDGVKGLTSGESRLVTFAHREIQLAANERYLQQRDKAPSYHKTLVEYFIHSHQTSILSAKAAELRASRHVMTQPLFWNVLPEDVDQIKLVSKTALSNKSEDDSADSHEMAKLNQNEQRDVSSSLHYKRVYNLRTLIQLPAQLALFNQSELLKSYCLCNLEFLLAKLSAFSVDDVLKDLHIGLTLDPRDGDLHLMTAFLEESREILSRSPIQLASQLVGRLRRIIDEDKPLAPRDPVNYPQMKILFRQIKSSTIPILIPSNTCLLEPSSLCFDTLSSHTAPLTAISSTADVTKAVTSSQDNTMKFWCMSTGRCLKTICGVGKKVLEIEFCLDDSAVVTSEADCIRVWDLSSGECLWRLYNVADSATISVVNDGRLLAALYQGTFRLKFFDLQNLQNKTNSPVFEEHTEEKSLQSANLGLISKRSYNSLLLYGLKNDSRAMVYNFTKKEIVRRLRVSKMEGSINALATSVDYFVVAVRYPCAKAIDSISIELFDGRTFDFVRLLKGCVGEDVVSSLHVNERGTHALSFCCSTTTGVSYVSSWGLDNNEHKHIAKHRGRSLLGSAQDFTCVLTASSEECFFRKWNVRNVLTKKSSKEKQRVGIMQLFAMKGYPRYVAARLTNGRELAVWNLTKNKKRGQMIYVERNLCKPDDVVIVAGTIVLVLSGKVLDIVGDRQTVVYKTLKQYDIIEKKFTSINHNCGIVFCQADEYRILNNNLLIGLSENRKYPVIYSMETGQVLYEMRNISREGGAPTVREFDFTGSTRSAVFRMEKQNSEEKFTVMTPWARRLETQSSKNRRERFKQEEERRADRDIKLEKNNSIDKSILSADKSILVTSYFSHHLCVFDMEQQQKITTLESSRSFLHLYVASLTPNGKYLAHINYDDKDKLGYITVWNCRTGKIRRKLKNQTDVMALALSDDAKRVVFGKQPEHDSLQKIGQNSGGILAIWDLARGQDSHCIFRELRHHRYLHFHSNSQIKLLNEAQRALVLANDISLWDLEEGALLSIFSPDKFIVDSTLALGDHCLVLAFSDLTEPICLRSVEPGTKGQAPQGQNIFGEEESDDDDSDADDDDDEDDDEEKTA